MVTVRTYCDECKNELDERPHLSFDARKPCPFCDSKMRRYSAIAEDGIEVHESVDAESFPPGSKKWRQKTEMGDSLYRQTGEWNKLNRNYNRDTDEYTEQIMDKEGNVIKNVKEPLSEHRGHGSAKKQKEKRKE